MKEIITAFLGVVTVIGGTFWLVSHIHLSNEDIVKETKLCTDAGMAILMDKNDKYIFNITCIPK